MESAYRSQVEKVKEWIEGRENVRVLFVSHGSTIGEPRSTAADVLAFLSGDTEGPDADRSRSDRNSLVEVMARVVDVELRRHVENDEGSGSIGSFDELDGER